MRSKLHREENSDSEALTQNIENQNPTRVRLQSLANKITGQPVKYEFQRNPKSFEAYFY